MSRDGRPWPYLCLSSAQARHWFKNVRSTRVSTGLYRVLLGAPRLKVADVSTAPAVIATRPATGSNSLPNQLLRAVALLALRLSPCPFFGAVFAVVRRSALNWCPTASDRMKRPRSSRRTYRLWVPVSMSSRFGMVRSSSRHSLHSRLDEVKENHQATAVRLRLPCTSPFLRRHEAPDDDRRGNDVFARGSSRVLRKAPAFGLAGGHGRPPRPTFAKNRQGAGSNAQTAHNRGRSVAAFEHRPDSRRAVLCPP